ncbi:uncharacterized protein LOC123330696 [Bubalus bubalis]|uniref:uncharacterized protein LOC123330696 n=1 Tax=Bubalus bubalis TaxID=89462 RepID=UPI001E1B783E|nr:uncharacterized protein LOC123330696 [Bubalus bubalis]
MASGAPSGPRPLPPPSCCLPPSGRPRGTFSQRKPRHRPNFRPDRFQPAAARRRAAAPWRPAARRPAPPRPALAIPFLARRTYVRRRASRGRGSRCTRHGAGPSPRASAWVPGVFTRSLNCKLVRPQLRGFGTRCLVFQDFETGTSNLAFPKRLLPSAGALSPSGVRPERVHRPVGSRTRDGEPSAGWGAPILVLPAVSTFPSAPGGDQEVVDSALRLRKGSGLPEGLSWDEFFFFFFCKSW